jgi:hypothetical protein
MKPTLEEKDAYRKKLFSIVDHINNVSHAAEKLAVRIIDTAETQEDLDFARRLVQRVRRHDLSKFEGIEWESLHRGSDDPLLKTAIHQHQQTNDHHPQYFIGGVFQMNDLQLAELVCDLKSRSMEMGTDLRTYIKDVATVRFGFTVKSKVYQKIKKYVDLILDEKFA